MKKEISPKKIIQKESRPPEIFKVVDESRKPINKKTQVINLRRQRNKYLDTSKITRHHERQPKYPKKNTDPNVVVVNTENIRRPEFGPINNPNYNISKLFQKPESNGKFKQKEPINLDPTKRSGFILVDSEVVPTPSQLDDKPLKSDLILGSKLIVNKSQSKPPDEASEIKPKRSGLANSETNIRPRNTKSFTNIQKEANLVIYDRYAAKYTLDQLTLAITRSKFSGLFGGAALGICFVCAAITLDYIKIKSVIDFKIISIVDLGILSNIRKGLIGWPLLLLFLMIITFVVFEALDFKSSILIGIISTSLIIGQVAIVVLCFTQTRGPEPKDNTELNAMSYQPNYVFVAIAGLIWFVGELFVTFSLIYYVERMKSDLPDRESSSVAYKAKRMNR